jgi:3'-phosphoadenosine 5'-phosphosulfate sulfotransferase (PAPS reductase)/FAD synthetase
VKDASRSYSLPWALGFSGGKDSTTALSLTLKAKEEGAEISNLCYLCGHNARTPFS